jgi:hypothetical protein
MFNKPEIVKDFILDVERCIRRSENVDSVKIILENATMVSTMSEDTEFMMVEGVLTTVYGLYTEIVEDTYPTPDELKELSSSICEKLQTMAQAVASQDEREVWSCLMKLPIDPLFLKHKIYYENRIKREKISVDFEGEEIKKRIYKKFLKDDESDTYKKMLAKILGKEVEG